MSAPAGDRPAFSVHLDAIRGLAALAVFAGHARDLFIASPRAALGVGQAASANEQIVATHGTIGRQAVIVFFVLSGLLVGGGVLRARKAGNWAWAPYLSKRLARLWTVLVPALLIGLALDQFGLHWFDPATIYGGPVGQSEILAGLGDRITLPVLFGNILFLQGIAVPTFGTNVALWSLAYEFWYYIAFPLACLAAQSGAGPVRRAGALIGVAAIGICAGRMISLYFLIWVLGAGLAAAPLLLSARFARRAVLPALALFAAGNVLLLRYPFDPILGDFVTALLFALLTYPILHLRDVFPANLYARAAHGLSEMSYTLYLSHLPVLVLICAIVLGPWHRLPLDPGHGALILGILAVVFAYCWVCWYCFERNTGRIRRLFASRFSGKGQA